MAEPLTELRQKIAVAMRILAMHGCVRHILGHVSARIPGTNEMFLRCRGGNERGLLYTETEQIRRLDFDGQGMAPGGDYMVPLELPIHGEIYKARPEANAVVHAHPYACVLCSVLGLELRPIFGAFDPPVLAIAARGVPVYPRSILITSPELAADFIAAMGERDCCLLKGHGITSVGPSVEAATLLALRLESLARANLDIALTGRVAPAISEQDMETFRDVIREGLGTAIPKSTQWIWAHLVQLLEDGVGVPKRSKSAKRTRKTRPRRG